ncbi:MAG: colanic acid/biofilm transcriptional regulator McbR [Armatimonadaceae bacterium]
MGMAKKQNSDSNRFTVADRIEQSILSGQRKPGGRLREISLAQELGVSQGSIREALAELEIRGLVVKYPNRGTYVIELDAQALRDVFQVRGELEPLACLLLAGCMTPEAGEALRRLLEEIRATAERGDYPACQNATFRFHQTIWAYQPNRMVEKLLNMICLPLFAYDLIRRYSERYANYTRLIRQHELLLTTLVAGDGETAARLMRRFLKQWLREDLHDYGQLSQSKNETTTQTHIDK